MKVALGAVVLAMVLAGCGNGKVDIADAVHVEGVPACLTWPVELAGDTYFELPHEDVEGWIESHEDPYGGTPQPQASARWPDDANGRGTLYRYEDGTALFVGEMGNWIYFTDEEREFDAVC